MCRQTSGAVSPRALRRPSGTFPDTRILPRTVELPHPRVPARRCSFLSTASRPHPCLVQTFWRLSGHDLQGSHRLQAVQPPPACEDRPLPSAPTLHPEALSRPSHQALRGFQKVSRARGWERPQGRSRQATRRKATAESVRGHAAGRRFQKVWAGAGVAGRLGAGSCRDIPGHHKAAMTDSTSVPSLFQ